MGVRVECQEATHTADLGSGALGPHLHRSVGWCEDSGCWPQATFGMGSMNPQEAAATPSAPQPRTAASSTGRWGHSQLLTGLSPPLDRQQMSLPLGLRVQGPTLQLQESCPKPRQAQTEKK